MKCSKCGYDNNEGNFCEKCGAPLENAEEIAETASEADPPVVSERNSGSGGGIDENFLKSLGELGGFAAENEDNDSNTDLSGKTAKSAEGSAAAELGANVADTAENAEIKDPISEEALENLKKYEEGTITHPEEKAKNKQKRKFYCPQNPMLWSFLWLLLFGVVLGALSVFFFNVDLDGTQIVFGIVFSVFTATVLGIDFAYYFPAALALDGLLKGKGTRLEYKLKKHELVDQAEKAKKKNRGFYLAIALFGLAFSVYYIYILANAMVKTDLMWISLYFSIGVFVIFALLFFIMPKFNYERMMQNGERVIVGSKSVYYGGTYYHWNKIRPEATFGNLNTKKHKLEIVFTQELKNGDTKRRKVEMYAPDTALREITRLLEEYEEASRKYREKQLKNTVINASDDDNEKKGKKK